MRAVTPGVRVRPRYRGVSHQWAFVGSTGLGVALISTTHGTREVVAASVFAVSVSAMFAASALYHRVMWPTAQRRQLFAKLDHAAIYLLISGTYTPVGLLVLRGAWRPTILAIAWSGAGLAIALKLFRGDTPKWVPRPSQSVSVGWRSSHCPSCCVSVGSGAHCCCSAAFATRPAQSSTREADLIPGRRCSGTTRCFTPS